MNSLKSFPPRTPIYSIEPINNNCLDVESFHHYVYRVAQAHSLNVRRLLIFCLNEPNPPGYLTHNKHATRFSTQETLVECLERLTRRNNLSNTTLLYYKEVINDNRLYRKFRAWCPFCLSDKKNSNYERLSWALSLVTTCIKHEQFLIEKCASCQEKLLYYNHYGWCSYCKSDLSSMRKPNKASLSELEQTEQIIKIITAPRMKKIPVRNSIPLLSEPNNITANNFFEKWLAEKPMLSKAFKFSRNINLPIDKVLDERLVNQC